MNLGELLQKEIAKATNSGHFQRLEALKGIQNKIIQILLKRSKEESSFLTQNFLKDAVYLHAKKIGDRQTIEKFHRRNLTRSEYVVLAKKFDIELGIDYYYENLDRFTETLWSGEGYCIIKSGDKQGIQDMDGNEIVETKYDKIKKFHDGFAAVRSGDLRGFVDRTGREICAVKYSNVRNFCNGFAAVKFGDKRGFIDVHGREICDLKYGWVSDFGPDYALVEIWASLFIKKGWLSKDGKFSFKFNFH